MSDARCPVCNGPLEPDRSRNATWPFCSPRCRDVDLGRWLGESYRIADPSPAGAEGAPLPPEHNRDE